MVHKVISEKAKINGYDNYYCNRDECEASTGSVAQYGAYWSCLVRGRALVK